jgi:HPt (histidine-containing phosphotransfer) domain-containing protein
MSAIDLLQTSAGNPVFDPRKLEEHIARSESRALAILDIVQRLVSAGLAPVDETRAAIGRGQHHQAAHMLHTLNGSIANLGGRRVCELASELELLLDQGANDLVLNEMLNCLEREFAHMLKSAEIWLQTQQRCLDLERQRPAAWELRLQELTTCLQENNLKAFDLFDELQQRLQSQMPPEAFLGFRVALQSLDFDNALHCIQNCCLDRDAAAP